MYEAMPPLEGLHWTNPNWSSVGQSGAHGHLYPVIHPSSYQFFNAHQIQFFAKDAV